MRIESKRKINIGGKQIGGPAPLICSPLVAGDINELARQADRLIALSPDLIEWRLDHYTDYDKPENIREALSILRQATGETPIILTCRSAAEGGNCRLSIQNRLKVNQTAVAGQQIDFIDTELSNGAEAITALKRDCDQSNTKLILSYHDFKQTPDKFALLDRLKAAQDQGAHIAKIAVMPQTPKDVLTLLDAAYSARTTILEIPIIAISMGKMGIISRIAGGFYGSDITFAVGQKSSAPGQIPVNELRRCWQSMSG